MTSNPFGVSIFHPPSFSRAAWKLLLLAGRVPLSRPSRSSQYASGKDADCSGGTALHWRCRTMIPLASTLPKVPTCFKGRWACVVAGGAHESGRPGKPHNVSTTTRVVLVPYLLIRSLLVVPSFSCFLSTLKRSRAEHSPPCLYLVIGMLVMA